jgi:hypothetical protein
MKLEIKTGNEIYFEGCDVREANKKSNYSTETSKERTLQHKQKWVKVDSMIKELTSLLKLPYSIQTELKIKKIIKELKETK